MSKNLIFPCFAAPWPGDVLPRSMWPSAKRLTAALTASLALCLTLAWAPVHAADPDADLLARKPAHEQALKVIESERLDFQKAIALREEECLQRFLSGRCMDVIRTDYMTAMRGFDLRRENERQALRTIDAEIRQRVRERRISARPE